MRLPTAALAACLAASPAPAAEPYGPPCLTPDAAMANARAHGALVGRLDGAEAQALLDAVNRTGELTDFGAATLIVVLRPSAAIVAMFGTCHTSDVTIRLDAFAEMWREVRGVGV